MVHRQELQANLDQMTDTYDCLSKQFNESNRFNDLKNSLLAQIDQWQSLTIQKVKQVTDEIRQQVNQMWSDEQQKMKGKLQGVIDELRKRKEEDNFAENDLTRLKNYINELQQELEKLRHHTPFELHVKSSEHIEWNRLIYLEHKVTDIKKRKSSEAKSGGFVHW